MISIPAGLTVLGSAILLTACIAPGPTVRYGHVVALPEDSAGAVDATVAVEPTVGEPAVSGEPASTAQPPIYVAPPTIYVDRYDGYPWYPWPPLYVSPYFFRPHFHRHPYRVAPPPPRHIAPDPRPPRPIMPVPGRLPVKPSR